jgi:glycosyltransferase involved in cell wall biosynthesis
MRISVITVAYNSASTIEHTLRSFISQDYQDKELIVVDGGSTDATYEIANRLRTPQIQLFSEPDRGIYDAMNKGLRLFSGDAIGFLNSDDKFNGPRALSLIADALREDDAAYGHLRYVHSHGELTTVRMWRAQPRPPAGFRAGWVPSHPTFYCRRWVADEVGRFDTELRISADYDWMLRAIDVKGASVGVIDEVLVDMATGGASTRSLSARMRGNLEKLRSRRKHFGTLGLDYAFFAMPLSKIAQKTKR